MLELVQIKSVLSMAFNMTIRLASFAARAYLKTFRTVSLAVSLCLGLGLAGADERVLVVAAPQNAGPTPECSAPGVQCLPPISEAEYADALRRGLALGTGTDDKKRYELYKRLSPLVVYAAYDPKASASTLLYQSNANYQPARDLDLAAQSFNPPGEARWVGETYDKSVGTITQGGKTTSVVQPMKRSVLIYVGKKIVEQTANVLRTDYQRFYAQPTAQLQRYDAVQRAKTGSAQTFTQAFALARSKNSRRDFARTGSNWTPTIPSHY